MIFMYICMLYIYTHVHIYLFIYGTMPDCMCADLCVFCEANILGTQSCVLDPLGLGSLEHMRAQPIRAQG